MKLHTHEKRETADTKKLTPSKNAALACGVSPRAAASTSARRAARSSAACATVASTLFVLFVIVWGCVGWF